MFTALRQNPRHQRVAFGAPFPAPVEGWDTNSPLAEMDPKRAVILDNFFPGPDTVNVRRGFKIHHGVGLNVPLESLMTYNGPSTSKMFAAGDGNIWEVTTFTGVGADSPTADDTTVTADSTYATVDGFGVPEQTADVTGLGSNRWQHINVTTTGGSYLYLVNGVDTPRYYNGSAWATPTITGIGITPANFVTLTNYKSRLWFTVKNSLDAVYLPLDSIQGAAVKFPLAGLFNMGGELQTIATWSHDSGTTPQDYLVFITSRGQVAVYGGAGPTATDWTIIGVFNIGIPIGRRCVRKVGSDLGIITVDGVTSLSQALTYDRAEIQRIAITSRIHRAMNDAARDYKSQFGWQLITYPRATMAVLNVPQVEGSVQQQFVMNTVTGAWCRFTGQHANCWELLNDNLYFGGNDGVVYQADAAAHDATGDYTADMQTAFSYLGKRGIKKRATMLQAVITSDVSVTPSVGVDVDFASSSKLSPISIAESAGALWDVANWDEDSFGSESLTSKWRSISGIGHAMAIRMKIGVGRTVGETPVTVSVAGFNLTCEAGEFL